MTNPTHDVDRWSWRQAWLRAVVGFARLRDQRQHWLAQTADRSPRWTFVELMCEYFDDLDLGVGYGERVAGGFVTEAEARLLERWHTRLGDYVPPNEDDHALAAILKDPDWIALCREAGRRCQALLSVLSDPSEREIVRLAHGGC